MAKAGEIVEVDDAGARQWAGEVLRARFAEIIARREPALTSDDIEAVHALRVATRRLRSALRSFAPLLPKKAFKNSQKDLKSIADALGAARDQDVAIAALEKLRKKARDAVVREGLGRLIDEHRAQREAAQPGLVEALTEENFDRLKTRFEKALDRAFALATDAEDAPVNVAGRELIEARLTEFCDRSGALCEPFRVKPLHELRITAKRLRYTVELFVARWGEQIAAFAEEVAAMQTYLGEVHDADAWLADCARRLKHNPGDQTELWLLTEFIKDRTKNYRGAVRLWSRWQADGFIEKLRAALV
ncbi:MAG: CHAD domain-containing protein [Acidobacteria bacterium]|nr:CHAD domain-containing protein [Acidobacteriota bacterium]